MMCKDLQEVARSAQVKGMVLKMAALIWQAVFVMEFLNLHSCMELVVHLPAVVTVIISLPLDQVFKVIVPHSTIEDCFNFIFLFTINECQRWRKSRLAAWNWVRYGNGQLHHWKDRMEALKLWWW
jgi:hypothetical protein